VRSSFDRRVVPEGTIRLLQTLQAHAPCHLAGRAALGGLYLVHRLSDDVDLFFHER
jgi:hypothetical protein